MFQLHSADFRRTGRLLLLGAACLTAFLVNTDLLGAGLPDRYFELLRDGLTKINRELREAEEPELRVLESKPGWRHFPSSILVAAVLYAKPHAGNPLYEDRDTLNTAKQIGDILVREAEAGALEDRLDNHRDTYMWLEAYRLLRDHLEERRRERWKQALLGYLEPLAVEVAERRDYPYYNSPFIVTSPNHFSLWTSTLYLGGLVFNVPDWVELGAKVMHRFAVEEQSEDGFWGEHSRAGPTTGYDYLTATGVALYWEHSHDPAAREALRRSTTFHEYFTYPDGTPVETVNDRNRYWGVSMWGHFGFSHFPDGRRYAEFLTNAYAPGDFSIEALGRIAQNALYFHEGDPAPIPQELDDAMKRLRITAGIRKSGPWVVCLSGVISTSAASQFYLDRQSLVSVFHRDLGLIISGANSKRQPELATFREIVGGKLLHMPLSSRLDMGPVQDRLAVGFNRFFSVLTVPHPTEDVQLLFYIRPKGRRSQEYLTLQLVLKPGEELETEAGKRFVLGSNEIDLGPGELGSWLRHRGWKLTLDSEARLKWPVRPFNPYRNGRETGLEHAVGALTVDLEHRERTRRFLITRE